VKATECDMFSLWRPSAMMAAMQETASEHSSILGVGMKEMTENGTTVMSYDGDISVNRSKHQIEAVYNADYNNYTYTGVVVADDKTAHLNDTMILALDMTVRELCEDKQPIHLDTVAARNSFIMKGRLKK